MMTTPPTNVASIENEIEELKGSINPIPEVNYFPSNTTQIKQDPKKQTKNLTGVIEVLHVNPEIFNENHNLFKNFGFANDPENSKKKVYSFQRKINEEESKNQQLIKDSKDNKDEQEKKNETTENKDKLLEVNASLPKKFTIELKRKREGVGDPSTGNYCGPWAQYENEKEILTPIEFLTETQKELLNKLEDKRKQKYIEKNKDIETIMIEAKSVAHDLPLKDYQGRSFVDPSPDLKNIKHECFIPTKREYTFVGHSAGVNCIRIFHTYGHLLLSGGQDKRIKVWDVMNHHKCYRTYLGHEEGIRDLCVNNDGTKFLSASYDKNVLLWDTEYGKVIRGFTNRKIPYAVKFNPDPDKQNLFLVGSANRRIYQYDIATGDITLQYDEHLGAINSITFINNNKRFVSTSDDKKVFLWEFGIPVGIKHISEPDMHAIPAATCHPNQKYFVGQSMDNRIVVYESKSNFRLHRKKKFSGHSNSGYGINICFSPDGQFLCSGDARGSIFFWDWKRTTRLREIKCHEKVTIDVQWHPIDPSKIFTASWDGLIHMWK